jgi:hypothetical protein
MKPRFVHIGSWNIEHFGRIDDSPSNQYAIAEHIEMSGVNVLALQEMYVTSITPGTPPILENSFIRAALDLIEEHTDQHWDYELFRNRDPADDSQLCGVAWNTARLQKVGPTLRINVQSEVIVDGELMKLWDRHPHAVKFAARPGEDADIRLTDFVLVPLHMKSNVGKRHTVMRTRFHEARQLMSQLQAIQDAFEEKDILFLGDTNCKWRDEDAIQEFVNNGFEDLNEDDIPTYFKGEDAPFDRIFVPNDASRKAFRFSRQYILRSASPLAHDKYLSDHYMVKTSIVVRREAANDG